LLAKAADQIAWMLNVPLSSRAGSLPQGLRELQIPSTPQGKQDEKKTAPSGAVLMSLPKVYLRAASQDFSSSL